MLRHLFLLLLTLTLATTSVRAAVMHGEMQGAYQMVICADTSAGLTTLTFDVSGKPIDAAHPCPECTTANPALLHTLPQIAPAPTHGQTLPPARDPASATALPPRQSARDPPQRA
ncbi:hypothetical protein [Cypionkella sp.]|uniref:hypothetical protein n=1 Tax=Cypionkella sp. TaxID=2811411 RepID=UPI002AB8850D|nr:hypothetical protein [Cypionkella sp.]MDZ4393931.1 hypothetical protein [Cypionkella sp.]